MPLQRVKNLNIHQALIIFLDNLWLYITAAGFTCTSLCRQRNTGKNAENTLTCYFKYYQP
jgi:hypothetical protein